MDLSDMNIFISGGCKNGKSFYAQRIAKLLGKDKLYYVATMAPTDGEDLDRISRHIEERRGWGFDTVERPIDIGGITKICDPGGSALLDSSTALLANEMFPAEGPFRLDACEEVWTGIESVMNHFESVVVVSDFIFSDAAVYDDLTERYRSGLAWLDRRIAHRADVVIEISSGNPIVHKCGDMWIEVENGLR
jgi:adenosylcobinamide kinase / adenosylcobinamide-phosphate guanylyltransferase